MLTFRSKVKREYGASQQKIEFFSCENCGLTNRLQGKGTMKSHSQDLFCNNLPTEPRPEIGKILVTGATGYIGGRLVPELLARGYKVRIMVRENLPEFRDQWPGAEVAVADALNVNSLAIALDGIHTAYYLIHSMLLGMQQFEAADIQAAINFRRVAEKKGLKGIIYLGGLGDLQASLSAHLRSRIHVAQQLKRGSVTTTILRAAIIIGSGSASYEIVENLVRNCVLFPTPSWSKTKCQPIAVRDVIKYLVGVLETPEAMGGTYDIGGNDILTYKGMLKVMAEILGKKRLFIPVPVTSIKLYSYFASLLTPVPVQICRCLLEGTHSEVVCQNNKIKDFVPFKTKGYKEAILRALSREEQDRVYTRWSDSYPPAHELAIKLHEIGGRPLYTSSYSLLTRKSAGALFQSICRIGGKEGWFHSNWMWRLRGALDRILMGVGSSRGRKSASTLMKNDVIDFWRVEDYKIEERLLLRAEMKLPGRAWLEFRINSEGDKKRLTVKAYYQTRTLFGKIYWYAFLPFHVIIFQNLIRQIERKSVDHGSLEGNMPQKISPA
jgi:uncharacterized protein YbjT (DUF2867 family)